MTNIKLFTNKIIIPDTEFVNGQKLIFSSLKKVCWALQTLFIIVFITVLLLLFIKIMIFCRITIV